MSIDKLNVKFHLFQCFFSISSVLQVVCSPWMIRKRWVYCVMSKSPYSVRIKQNTDQKKLRIWTSLTQWYTYVWSLSRVQNNVQFDVERIPNNLCNMWREIVWKCCYFPLVESNIYLQTSALYHGHFLRIYYINLL